MVRWHKGQNVLGPQPLPRTSLVIRHLGEVTCTGTLGSLSTKGVS